MKTRRATVSFKTVGCRLNQAETARIRASFEEAGFETTPFGEPCDVCVIHGCVVTSKAEEDGLRLARSIKRRYPGAFVILAGCAAELLKKEARVAPEQINYLAGQNDKFRLPEIMGMRSQACDKRTTSLSPRFDTQRAIVKIQDGCDCHCAYCIVPSVRGASRSRPADEIIDEISRLTLCGFPEIVLTGVNIGCYADGERRLTQLLEQIEAIPGLRRFRVSSLEICTVERDLIDFMAASKKICRFLHLPLQSGSNAILKAMGRPYTAEKYISVIEYARKKLAIFGLGTDIIAGFPGETAGDFEATERMIRNLPFSRLHVFSYSPRPGTSASSMPAQVSGNEKEKRAGALINLGHQKRQEFAKQFIGKPVSLLVEKAGVGRAEGWTGEYIWAKVKSSSLRRKQIARFAPESAEDGILLGKIEEVCFDN